MTHRQLMSLANAAVCNGNWIIRADNNGVSAAYHAYGFRWNSPGEWTEAPDWNESPKRVGGGLYGQDNKHGGYIQGSRMVFCETDGPHVVIGSKRVKVRRARILLVNEFPSSLKSIDGSLDLSGTNIKDLGGLKYIGGSLNLRSTKIKNLGSMEYVGGCLHLHGTKVANLGSMKYIGGYLHLYGTNVGELPSWVDRSKVLEWGGAMNKMWSREVLGMGTLSRWRTGENNDTR